MTGRRLLLMGVLAVSTIGASAPQNSDQRPNVVLILADDMGVTESSRSTASPAKDLSSRFTFREHDIALNNASDTHVRSQRVRNPRHQSPLQKSLDITGHRNWLWYEWLYIVLT